MKKQWVIEITIEHEGTETVTFVGTQAQVTRYIKEDPYCQSANLARAYTLATWFKNKKVKSKRST